MAIACPPLDVLDLQLERADQFSLRSRNGRGVSIDPDGEWLERVLLQPGQPVYDRTGSVFEVRDGMLHGTLGAPLRNRSTAPPRLDDPELSLSPIVRSAANEAAALGEGAVAAGLVLRYGEATSLDVLLAGRDPVAACLQEWWTGLGPVGRDDVSTRTLRAAVRLAETAEDLEDETEAEADGWLADVAALCRSRDDLHSAIRILQDRDPENVPRVALASADRALRELLGSLYVPVPHTDPVMGLAARQTACWWARSVGERTPDEPPIPEEDDS